jgi:hypothetical protein
MQNITSVAGLKNEIQVLESDQVFKGQQLKEQIFLIFENLKPTTLLKGTLNDFVSSPYLIENIIGSIIRLSAGFLTKKLVVGTSTNMAKKLLGTTAQFVVTNLVTQRPDIIKLFGQFVFHKIFSKKEVRQKLEDSSEQSEVG